MCRRLYSFFFFFFNDTATTEIYTLSLHDALPICDRPPPPRRCAAMNVAVCIKHVPDTEAPVRVRADGRGVEESGLPFVVNYYDEHGVEEALRIKERLGGTGTLGTPGPPPAAQALRAGPAVGAEAAPPITD